MTKAAVRANGHHYRFLRQSGSWNVKVDDLWWQWFQTRLDYLDHSGSR